MKTLKLVYLVRKAKNNWEDESMKLTKLFIALTTLCVATTSLYATTTIQKDKAVEIAKKYAPNGSKHITTDIEDDAYEVKFFSERTQEIYEVTLEAKSGILLEVESDSIAKPNSNAKNKYSLNEKYTPSKTQSVIKENLQKQYKELKVTDIKLAEDDGYWVYKVKLVSDKVVGDVKIDPETGKHLEREFITINNSDDDKPVTLPGDIIVEGAKVIGKDKAAEIIYNMMPRGTTIGETTFNKTGSLYYETVYYYKDMRIEGKVEALTGAVLEVTAKSTDFVDLHVENLYYKNKNYKPLIDANEAKEIALKTVPNTKITNQKLGEHDLLWAQYVEVSNKDCKAIVVIDSETGKVKEVEYKNTTQASNQILPWSKIEQIVKEQVSNAQIKDYQVVVENGELVYKVKVDNEKYKHEFTIDAYTGKILSYTKEEIKPSKPNPEKPNGILSKEEIKKIIMKEYGQHKITITEIEFEDDDCIYEVEAYNKNFKFEFEVHAKNGEIVKVDKEKIDHDDDDDDDKYNKHDDDNDRDDDDHDDDEWDD